MKRTLDRLGYLSCANTLASSASFGNTAMDISGLAAEEQRFADVESKRYLLAKFAIALTEDEELFETYEADPVDALMSFGFDEDDAWEIVETSGPSSADVLGFDRI